MSSAGISDNANDSVREVLMGHVARGYAPGLVALIGRGEDSHVMAVGAKALGGTDPMHREPVPTARRRNCIL
jgi:hypothetical protein